MIENSTIIAPFITALVTGSYLIGVLLYKRTSISLLQPILISLIICIAVIKLLDIPYPVFKDNSRLIDSMLGPSVVALGYLLYDNMKHIKGKVISILTSIIIGSIVGIISVIGICRLLEADPSITASLQPKSVTTPIALLLSERSGGIASLTTVTVIICGIFGGVIAPTIFRWIGVRSPIAKGLAMGAAAHGLGTARAIEIGIVEGALSGLAIGLMGVATSLLIPLIEWMMG